MTPKEVAAMIKASTAYKESLRAKPLGKKAGLTVLSWNVNGLTSLLNSRPRVLTDLISKHQPDLVFLQETKLQDQDLDEVKSRCVPRGWGSHWACSKRKKGYAGVGLLWRPGFDPVSLKEGIGVPEADHEGRCMTFETPQFFVVGAYVPNSGEGYPPKRLNFRIQQWEAAVRKHLKTLAAKKPVIYCGDLNVCHEALDLWGNHGPNSKGAGYTPEERQAFSKLLKENALVDSFRHRHPNVRAFTYWSYRFNAKAKNNGWRLDYCLVSDSVVARLHDAFMLPSVKGSDHCPIGIVLR